MTTLARLSFQLQTDQLASFASAYERHLAPLLKAYGLVAAAEEGRPPAAGVFSRLFSMAHPAEFETKERELWQDAAWQDALRRLGQSFSTTGVPLSASFAHPTVGVGVSLGVSFALYSTPAGPGTWP